MKRNLIVCLVLSLVIISGCNSKAKTIIFVNEDNVNVMGGEMTFSLGQSGKYEPQLRAPGYIVVFRIDKLLGDTRGKAGEAYRIQDDLSMKLVRKIDLSRSDEEIAAQFGIKQEK